MSDKYTRCITAEDVSYSLDVREITKHSRLRVIKIHGYGKIYAFRAWLRNGGVAVTTYESTGAFKFDNPSFKFSQLVVDEAHYTLMVMVTNIKNIFTLTKGRILMNGKNSQMDFICFLKK